MKYMLNFKKERDTKNMVRFKENTGKKPPIIGTLYINKLVAEDWEEVMVTIEQGKFEVLKPEGN